MATLTVNTASSAGLDIITDAEVASSGGDSFANTGHELVIIANGSDAPMTVTFVTTATVDGKAVADRAVTIADGTSALVGPFPVGVYNNEYDALDITYSDAADVTVYAFKVAP